MVWIQAGAGVAIPRAGRPQTQRGLPLTVGDAELKTHGAKAKRSQRHALRPVFLRKS